MKGNRTACIADAALAATDDPLLALALICDMIRDGVLVRSKYGMIVPGNRRKLAA